MSKIISKINKKVFKENLIPDLFVLKSKFVKNEEEKTNNISILDTSLNSDNLGDQIINFYCNKIFSELNITPKERYATHTLDKAMVSDHNLKIITGTNILDSAMNRMRLWQYPQDFTKIDNILLMGVGWGLYDESPNMYTKCFLKYVLSSNYVHSVRDSYTKQKLTSLGITNVVNTACPTMWKLDKSLCSSIPHNKARNVVSTITDYDFNPQMDFYMLDQLIKSYEQVFVWIQGQNDLKLLKHYRNFEKLKIIDNSFDAYTDFLGSNNDVDYVGTRLHAGIHALNFKKRSIIISIDNRAEEIAKDTNLPVLKREDLMQRLLPMINSRFSTDIKLPTDKISLWKKQFSQFA